MHEKILLISEADGDQETFSRILGSAQYSIIQVPSDSELERKINQNALPVILADYDLIKPKAELFYNLQQTQSKACLIFYGNSINAEELSQMLQRSVYSFIPREKLSERLEETILGGLENRRAFIEILEMADELKKLNKRLKAEKKALTKRNQELSFINLLSSEISYDFDWERILSRMINAGLEKTLEYDLFGILYRMGSSWTLNLHASKTEKDIKSEAFIINMLDTVNSNYGQKISKPEMSIHIIPKTAGKSNERIRIEIGDIIPLNLAGKTLGYVLIKTPDTKKLSGGKEVLLDTITNMLALSLKNAQEYYKLKEAAVTDSLTGVYNRKGLDDFLGMEISRAKRYKKPISFVLTDVDDFKSINDSMGHQAGDYILREVAFILKNSFRQPDIISRFGGDEFSILLPETGLADAESIMLRVNKKLEDHIFRWGSGKFKLKISYGISNSDELTENGGKEELIRLADSRLYTNKTNRK